jgi:2-oxo-3-hexenedioate decarboxylase
MHSTDIERLAHILDDATLQRAPTAQLTSLQTFTLADGYAIQRAGIALRAARHDVKVGMKMGLTSKPKMEQMGVREPIY